GQPIGARNVRIALGNTVGYLGEAIAVQVVGEALRLRRGGTGVAREARQAPRGVVAEVLAPGRRPHHVVDTNDPATRVERVSAFPVVSQIARNPSILIDVTSVLARTVEEP